MKTIAVATLCACALLPLPAAAQQEPAPAPAPAEEAPLAAPTPAPTPHPALKGPGYETLRGLARYLDNEMQHALHGAEQAPLGLRHMRMVNTNIRMFSRRVRSFQMRVESYRTSPFDVAAEVTSLSSRAQMLSRRLRRMGQFEHTYEDWDAMQDVLRRMQQVLAGEKVAVPAAHTPRPVPSGVPPLLRRLPDGGGAREGGPLRPGQPRPDPTPTPSPAPR